MPREDTGAGRNPLGFFELAEQATGERARP
jgi:hypothetical protein